jgi:hypothetical protein
MGNDEHADVYQPLPSRDETAAQQVCVDITEQQCRLEEHHTRAPHSRAAAKDGKKDLSGQGLHHEQKGGGEEDRDGEKAFHVEGVIFC